MFTSVNGLRGCIQDTHDLTKQVEALTSQFTILTDTLTAVANKRLPINHSTENNNCSSESATVNQSAHDTNDELPYNGHTYSDVVKQTNVTPSPVPEKRPAYIDISTGISRNRVL